MPIVVMTLGAALAVSGALCLTVLFARDASQEPIPAPVRVRPCGHTPHRGAVYVSQARRGILRPGNR